MYYEINVSLKGHHFFATAARSLIDEKKAETVFWSLASRFKKADGFSIAMTYHEHTGRDITPKEYK